MDLNSSLNTSGSSDGVVQPLVDHVFLHSEQKKQRLSAVMASLWSEKPDDENQKKFFQELQERLDPNNDDREVEAEDLYSACKDLYAKFKKTDSMSTNISPVKSVTLDKADFSPIKHDICQYSLSESEISSCSSPSEDVYVENARLLDECHSLKSHIRRLEETKSSLAEHLSNLEDKNSELENRCKELEAWKTKLFSENIERRRDAEVSETKIKELESQNFRLGEELTKFRKQCCELKEEKLEQLALQNELEEMQRHAEELHTENIEYKECLGKKEEEIAALKAECESKLTENRILIERIEILENENQTLKLAIQEKFQPRQLSTPIDSSDEEDFSVEPKSLKEELGGSLPCLNTSSDTDDQAVLTSSAVEENPCHVIESPPVTDKNNCHATEPLSMTEENSCHATETLSVMEENSCHAAEPLTVTEEKSCQATEPLTVTEEKSCQATEILPVIENSGLATDPLPVTEEASPLVSRRPEMGPIQHSVTWKVFLAIFAYFLHNCIFGFLLLFAVVTLISPYLNYSHLARDKPWFVSVSPGSYWPPPI